MMVQYNISAVVVEIYSKPPKTCRISHRDNFLFSDTFIVDTNENDETKEMTPEYPEEKICSQKEI